MSASAPTVWARLRLLNGVHLAKRRSIGRLLRDGVAEGGEQVDVEGERVYAEDALDVVVVRGEFLLGDRPRSGGRIGGRSEDVGREGEDLAAPLGGGAAVGAEAAVVGAAVVARGHLGAVEVLTALFEVEAAAFEEMDAHTAAREAHCEDQARDAGTDDTNSGLIRRAFRGLIEIDVQTAAPGAECELNTDKLA